jgi:hypothetical protein
MKPNIFVCFRLFYFYSVSLSGPVDVRLSSNNLTKDHLHLHVLF